MRLGVVLAFSILVLLQLFTFVPRPVGAGPTFVSGTLTGDTTWTIPGSPYIVTGDVTVPAGVTLTVEPGTRVRFDTTPPASHSIVVLGTLISVGRSDLRVTYTSDDPFPDRNDWVSILLVGSVGSVIEWSEFAWGSITIDIRQCSPRIANNTILESGLRGIQVIGPSAEPLIENNAIQTQLFNQRVGIFTQEADPVIRNNALTDNYFGIFVYLGGQPRIENNTIRDGWRGVLVLSATPTIANNTIEGNGLANFGGVGILLYDSASILRDNVIRNNGVGVDIPYDSKDTLRLSQRNLVNGVPLETLYRYRVRDLALDGPDLDSGHAAGFTGNATEQGLLTFYDSLNVTISRAILRDNAALVFSENSTLVVVNSTLTNSSNAFLLASASQVVSLNNDFRIDAVNLSDPRSTLTIKNFLHVRTLTDTSIPIPATRVRVNQDGVQIADRRTDPEGWTRWIVAAYGVLTRFERTVGPPDLSPSLVEAAVDHPQYDFRGTPRSVNMSSSHEELFYETDLVPPRVVDTIPAPNSVGVRFGSRITIEFSEAMNRTATEAAIQVLGHSIGQFEWSPDGRTVTFAIVDARQGETYFVQVLDTARDIGGNRLASTYVFTFDMESAPRRADLTPIWIASLVILAAGLFIVAWRSRSRAKALREEDGHRQEQGEN